MKRQMNSPDALQRNWSRREVLATGSIALLALAGCEAKSVPPMTSRTAIIPTSTTISIWRSSSCD